MVAVTLREPRPGTGGGKKADFMRPGAMVTLIALAPEVGVSMAVLRWTNDAQSGKLLAPAAMEIAALQELPMKHAAADGPSELDVNAARQTIQALLPPGGPTADSPVLVYWKDSLTGAGGYAAEGGEQMIETLQRSHAALKQVLARMPTTAVGSVLSNAMSRTLGINIRNRKTEVALDTARSIFPQAGDRISSVADHVGLANALLVAAHVIGAGVVKGDVGEESTPTPSGAAAAAEAGEDLLTPSGRPKRKRAVTSYAESVSGDGSEEAAAAAEVAEGAAEGEGEGEGEGEYQAPKEKRARAPRKRKPAAKSNLGAGAAGPAAGVAAAAGSSLQASPRPVLQLQQAAGVQGLAASAQPAAAAAGGGQVVGAGLAAVSVAPGPQLTAQQQQQLMATYLWQLQQAMWAQQAQQVQQVQGYGGGGGGDMGSPTAAGGLPASFPYAQALANQPVLPVVGPATGGVSYGGYGAFSYPAYGALGGGTGQQQGGGAGSASLLGGYAGSWPQLGGAAATTALPGAGAAAAAPSQFYATEAGQQQAAVARAEPAAGQEGPTAQQVLAAAQQAAEAQQAQQVQRGLGAGLPGSVSDFLQ